MKNFYLYEKFRNWEKDYDRIFCYSDPHFVDPNDKDSVNTHNLFHYEDDDKQIENINKEVHRNDLIVFFGDIGNPEKLKQLKCKNRILITGNHDRGNEFYREYFLEIYNGPLFISDKILLSHEPLHDDKNRWLNIHGHLHNIEEVDGNCIHENYICISANIFGYKPLLLNDLFTHKGLFSDYKCTLAGIDNIHRQTIDRATIRKQERTSAEQKKIMEKFQ